MPIKLLQITDCHLQKHEEGELKGFYPEKRLEEVTESIKGRLFDHLILTGDLAHPGLTKTYQRILAKTEHLAKNTHWVPGNHDDAAQMHSLAVADKKGLSEKVILQGEWAIVLLDSTSLADGKGSGSLASTELAQLFSLQTLDVKHILIVLHHPPINVGSRWQDAIKLQNSDEFWQAVSQVSNVRAVIFGHLHQSHHIKYRGVSLFCTPATAPQFKMATDEPELESDHVFSSPGFRELTLFDDGSIETAVYRVVNGQIKEETVNLVVLD